MLRCWKQLEDFTSNEKHIKAHQLFLMFNRTKPNPPSFVFGSLTCRFMGWPRSLLTDSGGFQMVSLLEVFLFNLSWLYPWPWFLTASWDNRGRGQFQIPLWWLHVSRTNWNARILCDPESGSLTGFMWPLNILHDPEVFYMTLTGVCSLQSEAYRSREA